jgi:hypothetical protein
MGLREYLARRRRRYFVWRADAGRFEELSYEEAQIVRRLRPVAGGMGDRFFGYYHINTNGDFAISNYAGAILSTVNVCTPWTTAGTATIYDGAVVGDEVAANVVATMSLLAAGGATPPSFIFDIVMKRGLRVLTASGTPGDMTVSYS